jgi:hypothetical protein
MRIFTLPFTEPPDVLVAGLTIGDTEIGGPVAVVSASVLQGEWGLEPMPSTPVPSALVGWMAGMSVPSEIGPMANQGGEVVMVPIGPLAPNPLALFVDPVQRWHRAGLPLDAVGEWSPAPDPPSILEPMAESTPLGLLWQAALSDKPTLGDRRVEVVRSGLLQTRTTAALVPDVGVRQIYPSPQSSESFVLTGTTVTGAGSPLGGCRVVAYQSGWRTVADAPVIIAETVSDGSGAFSLTLRHIDYQLVAYKEGGPDVSGVSRHDVTPLVATTLYLRDPQAADSGGGSLAGRPVRSSIVRRIA